MVNKNRILNKCIANVMDDECKFSLNEPLVYSFPTLIPTFNCCERKITVIQFMVHELEGISQFYIYAHV